MNFCIKSKNDWYFVQNKRSSATFDDFFRYID
nr:MAG TPA: hypothetical protein [Caudoviricetes sp.]